MNPVEDRVRAALAARSETFSASPDAWQQIQARKARLSQRRRRGRSGGGWLAGHSAFMIPAAAAVTVVAVALSATAIAHGLSHRPGTARPGTATQAPALNLPPDTVPSDMLNTDPAISAVFGLRVTRDNITAWNWIGKPSPHYWFPYIATGPVACHWDNQPMVGGSGDCWPEPALNAARPAIVLSNSDFPGSSADPVIDGLAEPAVTSVTAVLRDGQRVRAAIGTGRGFGLKAWSVRCPATGTTLVFAGADGQVITRLSTAAPLGPSVLDLPRPKQGGITMFSYPAGLQPQFDPAGEVTAYLVDGHVAFFTSMRIANNGTFSPYAASAGPAVDGMAQPYGNACHPVCRSTDVKAFGYAHGDVVRVVIRLPSGGQVTTDTYPAGWAGSDLRLWHVPLPDSVWPADGSEPKLIAIAYDAAGHAIGQVPLGQPAR